MAKLYLDTGQTENDAMTSVTVVHESKSRALAPIGWSIVRNNEPTKITYADLDRAYNYFNQRLFDNRLPRCLITLQRKKSSYGYFSSERFASRDGDEIIHEIALNPIHFHERSDEEVLSTLVHELCHLEQHEFGKPGRNGYHNAEWARLLRRVGLEPSSTGKPGGSPTGQKMSHYIVEGGPFALACAQLLHQGVNIHYGDRAGDEETRKKKAASKTRYTCPTCTLNAWAKPDVFLICGDCAKANQACVMEAEPS